MIPPPDKEALEAIERLKRQFERSIALWQRKQLRMRQNMIFSTIKVVRSWDLAQVSTIFVFGTESVAKVIEMFILGTVFGYGS